MSKRARRVALYARLSVTTEESVSVARQLDAGRKYAAARGWEVVLEATDEGVSATKNKPEARVGWCQILNSSASYDAVVVWKVDRLARRVLDFLHADEALQERGAGLVAVEDPVDMTTPQGRAFATMLAVFGEMEAAAVSARVTAARRALLHAGRRAGGRPPYGWMNAENPEGPGMVLVQDPERIEVVRRLAAGALAGESLHALARGLERDGIEPRARDGRKDETRWHDATVETILRNPVLAGMTPFRGDVIRDRDGLPVVDESVAILTTDERRRLLAMLDERKRPGAAPRTVDTALLSGLIVCGECHGPMHRATVARRFRYYRCPKGAGHAGISRPGVEENVETRFLAAVGHMAVVEEETLAGEESAPRLADVDAAISETLASMSDDDADMDTLSDRLASLKELRKRARAETHAEPETRQVATGETFAEAWHSSDSEREHNAYLRHALAAVVIAPTDGRRGGRGIDPARVELVWKGSPEAEALGLT